jgi:hypothetical protein
MTNISLYKSAADVQQRIMLCVDPETGEIDTDKLDMIEAAFHDRAVAVVAVFKGKGHTIDTLKSYLAEIQDQIKREQKNQERLKDYLQSCMIMTGTTQIESDDKLLRATLYRERDESVELDEGVTFPASLCADPKPPEPSKTKIKSAILAGEPVAGARIVKRDRLAIK